MTKTSTQSIIEKITEILDAALSDRETDAAATALGAAVPDADAWAELLEKLGRHKAVGCYLDPVTSEARWEYDDIFVLAVVRNGEHAQVSQPTLLHAVGDLLADGGALDDLYSSVPTVPCLIAAAKIQLPDGSDATLVLRDQRGIGVLAAVSGAVRKTLRRSGFQVNGHDPLSERQYQLRKQLNASDNWQRMYGDDHDDVISSAIFDWFARQPRMKGYEWRLAADDDALAAFVSEAPSVPAEPTVPNRARHVLNQLQDDTHGQRDGAKSGHALQRDRGNTAGSGLDDTFEDDVRKVARARGDRKKVPTAVYMTGEWLREASKSPENLVVNMVIGSESDDPQVVRNARHAARLSWVAANFGDAFSGRHPYCSRECLDSGCMGPSPAIIGAAGDMDPSQSTAYLVGLCDDPNSGLYLSDIGLGRIVIPKRDGSKWLLLVTKELADLFNRRVNGLVAGGSGELHAIYQALADCGWTRTELRELSNQVTTKEGRPAAHWQRPEDQTGRRSNDLCDEATARLRAVMADRVRPPTAALEAWLRKGLTDYQATVVAMDRQGATAGEIAQATQSTPDSVRKAKKRGLQKAAKAAL